jgi:urease accessory protein
MAENASLNIFEAIVFGRAARQETMSDGLFVDRWSIHRGDRLVYADTLKLEGQIGRMLQQPSVAKGRRAMATFLHLAPDAEGRLDNAREFLASDENCEAGASAWNGLLAVRFCAVTIEALRNAASRFLIGFRGVPLPRVWLS